VWTVGYVWTVYIDRPGLGSTTVPYVSVGDCGAGFVQVNDFTPCGQSVSH